MAHKDSKDVLYIERGSAEENKIKNLMDLAGLSYQVIYVSRDDYCDNFDDRLPALFSTVGKFCGLKDIEWYVKAFSKNSLQHGIEASKEFAPN